MRKNSIIAVLLAGAFVAASVSGASARGYYRRGPGPVLGLVGGVIVGAATIATLPFRVLGAVADSGRQDRRDYGYAGRGDYYGQEAEGYGPPPPPPPPPPRYYYRRPYGPPPGYYGYGYGY